MRVVCVLLAFFAIALSGCKTAGYYAQAVRGQYELLAKRRPIPSLVDDPKTLPELKRKLDLVLELRRFAVDELDLPLNGSYLHYADLHRRFAVWNVHAAPKLSLKQKKWFYPFVGSLSYRGYFSREAAFRYGTKLHNLGYDVHIDGVETYSTLGWFNDPILNTFVHHSDAGLAEILFHELAHQKLFIRGDTDFNEAFATAVAEEGTRRWLKSRRDSTTLARFETAVQRDSEFAQLIATTRRELEALYTSSLDVPDGTDLERIETVKLERKRRIIDQLRTRYQALKKSWNGYSGYDAWFSYPINNAQLNSVATYYDLVPAFQRLLQANGGDLKAFYEAVAHLGKLPEDARRQALEHVVAAGIPACRR